MFIHITPKRLTKDYEVSATFEANGVPYEERFRKVGHFKAKLRRSRDKFINAVNYKDYRVVDSSNIKEYIQ